MARARKAILFLTLTVMLLLAAGLFLYACEWTSPSSDPDSAGRIAPAVESPAEGDSDPSETDPSQGTSEGESPSEEEGTPTESGEIEGGDEGDSVDEGEGDGGEEGDPVGEGESDGGSSSGGEGTPSGDPEEGFDFVSYYYDTSYAAHYEEGEEQAYIYRQIRSDRAGVTYRVYVEMQEIGRAEVSEQGEILLDCGFVDARCEIWGTWDEAGPTRYFIYFNTLDCYREIFFRDELLEPTLYLDVRQEEISYFSDNSEENGATDPSGGTSQGSREEYPTEILCTECRAVMTEGGAHDPACGKYAALPTESVFLPILVEARGVWEDLSEEMPTGADGENYHITLSYITEEGLAALRELLTELSSTGWVSATVFHAGDLLIEGKLASLDAVLSEEGGVFSARFSLRAYPLD